MIRRALDWLANAKFVNDEVNADAVRITALELALRQANLKAIIWQTQAPLVAYANRQKANRQKANRARYDAKRRGK